MASAQTIMTALAATTMWRRSRRSAVTPVIKDSAIDGRKLDKPTMPSAKVLRVRS